MSCNPDEPTPLAIRGCSDREKAKQDVEKWVKKTSGRKDDDPQITKEVTDVAKKLKSLGGDRDAVLLLERNDAKELEVTVLTPATRSPLVIRGCRDRVKATQDILQWVQKTSGRTDEVRSLMATWESLKEDALLLAERSDAMELHVTVLTAQQ